MASKETEYITESRKKSMGELQDLIGEAVTTDPWDLTPKLVKALPRLYILNHLSAIQLLRIWKDLPSKLKEDEEIKERLPCLEHYNRPEDTVHIDGPPPPKYKCYTCKIKKSSISKK